MLLALCLGYTLCASHVCISEYLVDWEKEKWLHLSVYFLLFFIDCTADLYVQLPDQVYYVNPGDQLCIVCNSTAISNQTMEEALISFEKVGSNQPVCSSVPGCIIDTTEDQLCFMEGIPETSFGSYICQHAINLNNSCEVPFNITKAGKLLLTSYLHCLPFSSLSTQCTLVNACN